jgi:hypothetical protein
VALRNRGLAELAVFVVAAAVHTWPLASAPAALGRVDNADTALNAWIVAWVGHQLAANPLRLFDANIFHPEPRTLAFSEIMLPQALMGAPLTWLRVDAVLVYNLLALAGFALSGWAMALVVARWTGDRAAGIVAGLAYAFNAHTLVRFGHLQALHVQFLPLALAALDDLLRAPTARRIGLVAVLCVLQALTSNYLLVMTIVAMTAALVVRREAWQRDRLIAVGIVAAASALMLAPFLAPYYQAYLYQGLVRSIGEVTGFSATVGDWLATGGRLHYGLWSHRYFGAASALFPGLTVLAFSASAVATGLAWRDSRARMALAIAAIGFLLSFGVRLPGYALLFEAIPLLQGIRVVSRFGWLALFGGAILTGLALARLRARLPPSAAAGTAIAAALLVTIEAARTPMAYVTYEGIPRIYDRVAALPDEAVLVELPFPAGDATRENGPSVLNSTLHFRRMLNGYSGFTPESYHRHAELMQSFPSADTLTALRAIGVTHIVVHERRVPPQLIKVMEETPGLARIERLGDQSLFALAGSGPR